MKILEIEKFFELSTLFDCS